MSRRSRWSRHFPIAIGPSSPSRRVATSRSSPSRSGAFEPQIASVADATAADAAAGSTACPRCATTASLTSRDRLRRAWTRWQRARRRICVVAALVGAVGLRPTLAAIRAGRDIALANKEVHGHGGGAGAARSARAHGVALLPVDSEHSAIFQALAGQRREDVSAPGPDRLGRTLPRRGRRNESPRPRSRRRSPTRTGTWARRSPSIRRP